jgi:hypothetical protein
MKLCPKCRTYFEDSLLRFCANDGIPLAELDQTSKLWTEGKEYIRETNRTVHREIRRSQIKKTLSILVTTVVVTSVMSVITLRSWIYTHPKETAEIRGEKTEETKIITQSTPKTQEMPVIIESIPLVSTLVREGLPKTDKPVIKITPTTATPLPSSIPTVSKTIKKIECTEEMKEKAKVDILTSNTGYITSSVGQLEKKLAFKYYSERHPAGVAPMNLYNRGNVFVEVNTCSSATSISKSEWFPTSDYIRGIVTPYTGTKTFSCKKIGKDWKCVYVK